MVMGISAIIESDEDIEISNKKLGEKPRDVRAHHITTARELDLFKFSSSYQTFGNGMNNLENETGIHCGVGGDLKSD